MGKAAVYELKKKGEPPLFGGYYYEWPERPDLEQAFGGSFNIDDESEFNLEKIQELHEFNR